MRCAVGVWTTYHDDMELGGESSHAVATLIGLVSPQGVSRAAGILMPAIGGIVKRLPDPTLSGPGQQAIDLLRGLVYKGPKPTPAPLAKAVCACVGPALAGGDPSIERATADALAALAFAAPAACASAQVRTPAGLAPLPATAARWVIQALGP